MMNLVWVGVGGASGAICRYLVSVVVNVYWPAMFPVATLVVNVIGSFLMGLGTAYLQQYFPNQQFLVLMFLTGFMGALTTFSTFSMETLILYQHQALGLMVLNILANVMLCLLAVMYGMKLLNY